LPSLKKHLHLQKKQRMNFPEELKYTKEHEWVKVDGNIATIGITEFAQSELGDIVYVDINTQGQSLNEGEVFGTVEAVKTVSDLFMPLSGKIQEFNKGLESSPESVNKDPYGSGWMIRIEIGNASEVERLMNAADYRAMIGLNA
jgi:glycine cleavage system H protein